jgi:hypothetical protein
MGWAQVRQGGDGGRTSGESFPDICGRKATPSVYIGFGRRQQCGALGETDIPRAQQSTTNLLKSMGDRSPKDNQKKSSQKSAAASSSAAKKSQAIADKKAASGKKK